jgi:hypothetical protein
VIACWSSKGGSGTTVVAVALAVLLGRDSQRGSVFVDLAGDGPVAFGAPEPSGPGLTDWLGAPSAVGTAAIDRLEQSVGADVRLIPRGGRELSHEIRVEQCLDKLCIDDRPVVIDVGCVTGRDETADRIRRRVIAGSDHSLLVTRSCFLSIRRASRLPLRPTGIVLIEESGRALGETDIEDVLGVPVVASIAIDAAIARAVDAGLLASRLPISLGRSLRNVA